VLRAAAPVLRQGFRRVGAALFDMADPSEIPKIGEQLFLKLDAAVQFTPVMNADDLKKALTAMSS